MSEEVPPEKPKKKVRPRLTIKEHLTREQRIARRKKLQVATPHGISKKSISRSKYTPAGPNKNVK